MGDAEMEVEKMEMEEVEMEEVEMEVEELEMEEMKMELEGLRNRAWSLSRTYAFCFTNLSATVDVSRFNWAAPVEADGSALLTRILRAVTMDPVSKWSPVLSAVIISACLLGWQLVFRQCRHHFRNYDLQ